MKKILTCILSVAMIVCLIPAISFAATEDEADALRHTIQSDDVLELDEDEFNDACDEVTGEELDYIKFTLPDEDEGFLFYDYDPDLDEDEQTEVTSLKKYYYSDSPALSNVAFVPAKDFTGITVIDYKGYDVEGNSYTGEIKVTVEESPNLIKYSADENEVVDFDDDDFSEVCNDVQDEDLDYIKFSLPDSDEGILYYDYDEDEDGNTKVSSTKKYYLDSETPYIKRVTFVPEEDFSGKVIISYTGYDVKGDSYSERIQITVKDSGSSDSSTSGEAKVIQYSGIINNLVAFKDEDFNTACKSLSNTQLSYVQFKLPSSSLGTLYYGYSSNGTYTSKVSESAKYYYGSAPYLLNISFVPQNNVTGSITITYTGYDTAGASYTGNVLLTITGTSGLVSSKYFKDVDISYSWAVPYIDSLYEANIISGTSSVSGTKLYSPSAYITRGDFMYLLYKSLNFKTTSIAASFEDVTPGSYYSTAIQTARALGIAQGSYNKFYPNDPITREDAMVMVLRAVNITGKTIPSGDVSSLSKYSDGSSISDYSKSAVAALIKAGIITGSDDNRIYPKGNLTRAQTSAIIYRIKNM